MILSVIIPGYNTPMEWWVRALKSVIQACNGLDYEIICVDDGSNKQPLNESVFNQLNNVTINVMRLEHNLGLAGARNSAINIAKGKYITFVDSDDEVRPETYKCCIKYLDETQADICIFGVNVIWYKDGLQKHDIPKKKMFGKLSPLDVKKLYNDCLFNYSCNKLYSKDFLDRYKLLFPIDGMPCEDIIFNLNCLMSGANYCSVDYEGYLYYRSSSTQTSRYLPSFEIGTKLAADTWSKYVASNPDAKEYFINMTQFDSATVHKQNMLGLGSPSIVGKMYNLFRRILYIRPIRRWHLKRVFPNIEEY